MFLTSTCLWRFLLFAKNDSKNAVKNIIINHIKIIKMDTQFFPHFIRANYKGFQIENKEAIEIGNMFKIYLEEILKDKQELLTKISDINPITCIEKLDNPLKINGYEPVLLAHFNQFIKLEQSKTQDV